MQKCETCEYEKVCEIPDFVRNDLKSCKTYKEKKVKTNADKIRSMSDEELAELTLQHDDEYGYFYCSDGTSYQDYGKGYEEALKHEIEWLKSPTTN